MHSEPKTRRGAVEMSDVELALTEQKPSGPAPKRIQPLAWLKRHAECITDIVAFAICVAVAVGTEGTEPRSPFITEQTLYKHSYPLRSNTVPSVSVGLYSVGGPILAVVLHKLLALRLSVRRPQPTWYEVYRVCAAAVLAIAVTAALTNAVKVSVGRLRPSFASKCWPSGEVRWEERGRTAFGGYALCEGDAGSHELWEYRKSFPSGHASWSAAGLGFLTFWLIGQMRALAGGTYAWRMFLALMPSFGAVAVAITRIIDSMHHPSDVCIGLLLGWGIALLFYLQVFPWFLHDRCDVPVWLLHPSGALYPWSGWWRAKHDPSAPPEAHNGSGSTLSQPPQEGHGPYAPAYPGVGGMRELVPHLYSSRLSEAPSSMGRAATTHLSNGTLVGPDGLPLDHHALGLSSPQGPNGVLPQPWRDIPGRTHSKTSTTQGPTSQ